MLPQRGLGQACCGRALLQGTGRHQADAQLGGLDILLLLAALAHEAFERGRSLLALRRPVARGARLVRRERRRRGRCCVGRDEVEQCEKALAQPARLPLRLRESGLARGPAGQAARRGAAPGAQRVRRAERFRGGLGFRLQHGGAVGGQGRWKAQREEQREGRREERQGWSNFDQPVPRAPAQRQMSWGVQGPPGGGPPPRWPARPGSPCRRRRRRPQGARGAR